MYFLLHVLHGSGNMETEALNGQTPVSRREGRDHQGQVALNSSYQVLRLKESDYRPFLDPQHTVK
jgi:hypothetical protein